MRKIYSMKGQGTSQVDQQSNYEVLTIGLVPCPLCLVPSIFHT